MTNPFDRSFYKFLLGFVGILIVSFTIIYFVSSYQDSSSSEIAAPVQK